MVTSLPHGITRRQWLAGLGATLALITLPGCNRQPRPLRIAFLTDIHCMLEKGCPDALQILSQRLNQLRPEFILIGGDIVDGGFRSTPEAMEPRWQLALQFLGSLKSPCFAAAGNHDLIGAQKEDLTLGDGDPRQIFREKLRVPQLHQSYDIAGHHLILLDSVQPVAGDKWGYEGRILEPQINWLRDDLAKVDPATPILLVTHIPFVSTFFQLTGITDKNGAPPPSLTLVNGRDILALFQKHNLRLILQGHLHIDENLRWNNLHIVTGGAVCGRKWTGPNLGTKEGFGTLDLTPSAAPTWIYLPLGWTAKA
jgi:3',5'-cyclic-AMP phosphodiesterase